MSDSALMNTYRRTPVAFDHGEGIWLVDESGNRYFDALSGIAVCGLGHSHPQVTAAIRDQAGRLLHTSNLYEVPLQRRLAQALCAVSGMESVFVCNSGAEANEAAIKLARHYGHKKGIEVPTIIVMENAFHGRTMATLTATGNRKAQAGFEPLVRGFVRAPFNDLDAVARIGENNANVVAVMLEPIQGEGGINIANPDYLKGLRELCDQRGWLLMLDEVQTGNGRTGQFFAYQHYDFLPDVVTTAKGLGNGVPIGVCLGRGSAASVFQPGSHGTTFGGNPLACAAALSVISTLTEDNLIERAAKLGQRIVDGFKRTLGGREYVRAIRGQGLMIGIELDQPCAELAPLAKSKGLLINVTAESVVRLLPPLIMTDDDADWLVSTLSKLITVYAGDDRHRARS